MMIMMQMVTIIVTTLRQIRMVLWMTIAVMLLKIIIMPSARLHNHANSSASRTRNDDDNPLLPLDL